jgi:flagellar hook assembly protein FlgD
LADDADVAIRIYDAAGQLIRTLDLGHKQAGFYTDKDKAVHWDGRNSAGEKVASGVYFYTLYARSFRSTKKMTVAK